MSSSTSSSYLKKNPNYVLGSMSLVKPTIQKKGLSFSPTTSIKDSSHDAIPIDSSSSSLVSTESINNKWFDTEDQIEEKLKEQSIYKVPPSIQKQGWIEGQLNWKISTHVLKQSELIQQALSGIDESEIEQAEKNKTLVQVPTMIQINDTTPFEAFSYVTQSKIHCHICHEHETRDVESKDTRKFFSDLSRQRHKDAIQSCPQPYFTFILANRLVHHEASKHLKCVLVLFITTYLYQGAHISSYKPDPSLFNSSRMIHFYIQFLWIYLEFKDVREWIHSLFSGDPDYFTIEYLSNKIMNKKQHVRISDKSDLDFFLNVGIPDEFDLDFFLNMIIPKHHKIFTITVLHTLTTDVRYQPMVQSYSEFLYDHFFRSGVSETLAGIVEQEYTDINKITHPKGSRVERTHISMDHFKDVATSGTKVIREIKINSSKYDLCHVIFGNSSSIQYHIFTKPFPSSLCQTFRQECYHQIRQPWIQPDHFPWHPHKDCQILWGGSSVYHILRFLYRQEYIKDESIDATNHWYDGQYRDVNQFNDIDLFVFHSRPMEYESMKQEDKDALTNHVLQTLLTYIKAHVFMNTWEEFYIVRKPSHGQNPDSFYIYTTSCPVGLSVMFTSLSESQLMLGMDFSHSSILVGDRMKTSSTLQDSSSSSTSILSLDQEESSTSSSSVSILSFIQGTFNSWDAIQTGRSKYQILPPSHEFFTKPREYFSNEVSEYKPTKNGVGVTKEARLQARDRLFQRAHKFMKRGLSLETHIEMKIMSEIPTLGWMEQDSYGLSSTLSPSPDQLKPIDPETLDRYFNLSDTIHPSIEFTCLTNKWLLAKKHKLNNIHLIQTYQEYQKSVIVQEVETISTENERISTEQQTKTSTSEDLTIKIKTQPTKKRTLSPPLDSNEEEDVFHHHHEEEPPLMLPSQPVIKRRKIPVPKSIETPYVDEIDPE